MVSFEVSSIFARARSRISRIRQGCDSHNHTPCFALRAIASVPLHDSRILAPTLTAPHGDRTGWGRAAPTTRRIMLISQLPPKPAPPPPPVERIKIISSWVEKCAQAKRTSSSLRPLLAHSPPSLLPSPSSPLSLSASPVALLLNLLVPGHRPLWIHSFSLWTLWY